MFTSASTLDLNGLPFEHAFTCKYWIIDIIMSVVAMHCSTLLFPALSDNTYAFIHIDKLSSAYLEESGGSQLMTCTSVGSCQTLHRQKNRV